MSVGLILLIVAGLLVLLGVGQRVLDKLRLTDKQALLFIALIIAGGFLPEHDESPVHKLKRNDSSGLIEGGVFFWNIERNL